ncbi:hypothetical protein G6321_00049275 [Bradyrhizobium barranii subsp. barranii]|uniref:Uncharacterized protein n=1 Tax=Bradyrhizobium barranii subsp. barranii TaxID=2823807 RepID=A0A7Z0QBK0_9BRAD|nr:hypothetical protein [Bradyrhizobium barranii]UGX93504.1 hypothetical protein G6321_00049275 [Bradyrhizobium barranii subsp. barranii]
MANESEYELSPEQLEANSSTGYLVFNGRPDLETAMPLTSPDFETDIRASTEAGAVNALAEAGLKYKSAKLEQWKFRVSGVNDHAVVKVWVPQES